MDPETMALAGEIASSHTALLAMTGYASCHCRVARQRPPRYARGQRSLLAMTGVGRPRSITPPPILWPPRRRWTAAGSRASPPFPLKL